jgi:hypothetical protein
MRLPLLLVAAALVAPSAAFAGGMGRAQAPVRSNYAPAAMAASTFEELGVRAEIVEALAAQGISAPNKLQVAALPVLAGGADVILGAQTGSGKTLAYLIPLLQRLKDEEDCAGESFVQRPSRPRALVIVPTRELGDQVKGVAKSICHYLKVRSAGISGGVPLGKQAKLLAGNLDLLVATPGRLLAHADAGNLGFSAISTIVIDEVDTIFEAGFSIDLRKLLGLIAAQRGGQPVQHVAVGATHPEAAKRLYAQALPEAQELMVDVHVVPLSLRQTFVQVGSQPNDRCEMLIDVLGPPREDGGLGGGRTLIFCSSKDSARFVDHYLTERRCAQRGQRAVPNCVQSAWVSRTVGSARRPGTVHRACRLPRHPSSPHSLPTLLPAASPPLSHASPRQVRDPQLPRRHPARRSGAQFQRVQGGQGGHPRLLRPRGARPRRPRRGARRAVRLRALCRRLPPPRGADGARRPARPHHLARHQARRGDREGGAAGVQAGLVTALQAKPRGAAAG